MQCVVLFQLLVVLFSRLVSGLCPHDVPGLTRIQSYVQPMKASGVLVVSEGDNVLLDASISFEGILILGHLVVDDRNLNLEVEWIEIRGGRLTIGSQGCPIISKVVITFTGDRTTQSVFNNNGYSLGTNGIGVFDDGSIEIFGNVKPPSWTRLQHTANIGDQFFMLQDSVEWNPGDAIIITSTDYSAMAYAPMQSEVHYIKSVTSHFVQIEQPLKFMHWGENYQHAEVGLLTRNIVIQGKDTEDHDYFGGHIILHHPNSVVFEGVEFRRMGQQGIIDRYPVNWFLNREYGIGKNWRVTDCSIHNSYQRCVSIHDSQAVTIENVVCFSAFGHMFVLDDGGEMGNVWHRNLGIHVQAPIYPILPSDVRPTVFFVTNSNNTWTDNVAVDCHTAYWWALPYKPNGISSEYYEDKFVYPRQIPLKQFQGNVGHSIENAGLFVADMQNQDQSIHADDHIDGYYSPREGPYENISEEDIRFGHEPVSAYYRDVLIYKCRNRGVHLVGNFLVCERCIVMDSLIGTLSEPEGPVYIKDSYFVGETDNIGLIRNTPNLPDVDRSRVKTYTNFEPLIGFEMHDHGALQLMSNCTFENYTYDGVKNQSAISHSLTGWTVLNPQNIYEELTFINSLTLLLYHFPTIFDPEQLQADGPNFVQLYDRDGTTTGNVGSWVSTNQPFFDLYGDSIVPEWNAMMFEPSDETFVFFEIHNQDKYNVDYGDTLSEFYRAIFYRFGDTEKQNGIYVTGRKHSDEVKSAYNANLQVRHGYTIRWEHATPAILSFELEGAAEGEWIMFAAPYPRGTTFEVTSTRRIECVAADSVEDIHTGLQYYFDEINELLFIRIEETQSDFYREIYGFPYTDPSARASVLVEASCGRDCIPRSFEDFVVPRELPKLSDKYQAKLEPCQAELRGGSDYIGSVFIDYDVETSLLTWTIHHNLNQHVISVTINRGMFGENGETFVDCGLPYAPNRGAVYLDRTDFIDLFSGAMYVSIKSSNGEELRGQIGCVAGDCTAPPQIVDADPCQPFGATVDVFTDEFMGFLDMYGRREGFSVELSDKNSICGQSSVLWTDVGQCGKYSIRILPQFQPFLVDVPRYRYLQFFALAEVESRDFVLGLRITDTSNDEPICDVVLGVKYVDNFFITSEGWSRVRIPVEDLGITDTMDLYEIAIYEYNCPHADTAKFYIDQIQFIEDQGYEVISERILPESVYIYSDELCANTYYWFVGPWSQCQFGVQFRAVQCREPTTNLDVAPYLCEGRRKETEQLCEEECAPGCRQEYVGDGQCDYICNSVACEFDNGDCYVPPTPVVTPVPAMAPEDCVADITLDWKLPATFEPLELTVGQVLKFEFSTNDNVLLFEDEANYRDCFFGRSEVILANEGPFCYVAEEADIDKRIYFGTSITTHCANGQKAEVSITGLRRPTGYSCTHHLFTYGDIFWTISPDEKSISFAIWMEKHSVWIGLGFTDPQEGGMVGSDVVVASRDIKRNNEDFVEQYNLIDQLYGEPLHSVELDDQQDLFDTYWEQGGGYSLVKFSRLLDTGDPTDQVIDLDSDGMIWAYGKDESIYFSWHGPDKREVFDISLRCAPHPSQTDNPTAAPTRAPPTLPPAVGTTSVPTQPLQTCTFRMYLNKKFSSDSECDTESISLNSISDAEKACCACDDCLGFIELSNSLYRLKSGVISDMENSVVFLKPEVHEPDEPGGGRLVESTTIAQMMALVFCVEIVTSRDASLFIEYFPDIKSNGERLQSVNSDIGREHNLCLYRLYSGIIYRFQLFETGSKVVLHEDTLLTGMLPQVLVEKDVIVVGNPTYDVIMRVTPDPDYVYYFDRTGQIVWWVELKYPPQSEWIAENHNIFVLQEQGILELNPNGQTVNNWLVECVPNHETVDYPPRVHHEMYVPESNSVPILVLSDAYEYIESFELPQLVSTVYELDRNTGQWELVLNPVHFLDANDRTMDGNTAVNQTDICRDWHLVQDWTHVNGIHVKDDIMLLSARHMDSVLGFQYDPVRRKWKYLWQIGGENSQWTFPDAADRFYHQHRAIWLDNGNILLFDNGNFRPRAEGGDYSRGIEYKLDYDTMEIRSVWKYSLCGLPTWNDANQCCFSPCCGSMYRMDNGNTIVQFPSCSHDGMSYVAEVDPSGCLISLARQTGGETVTFQSGRVLPTQTVGGESVVLKPSQGAQRITGGSCPDIIFDFTSTPTVKPVPTPSQTLQPSTQPAPDRTMRPTPPAAPPAPQRTFQPMAIRTQRPTPPPSPFRTNKPTTGMTLRPTKAPAPERTMHPIPVRTTPPTSVRTKPPTIARTSRPTRAPSPGYTARPADVRTYPPTTKRTYDPTTQRTYRLTSVRTSRPSPARQYG